MRAAPVRSGISAGSGWLTPSGKIRIASPRPSVAAAASNMPSLPAGPPPTSWRRVTGIAPASLMRGPMTGWRKSGALASGTSVRGMEASSSIGSTSAFW